MSQHTRLIRRELTRDGWFGGCYPTATVQWLRVVLYRGDGDLTCTLLLIIITGGGSGEVLLFLVLYVPRPTEVLLLPRLERSTQQWCRNVVGVGKLRRVVCASRWGVGHEFSSEPEWELNSSSTATNVVRFSNRGCQYRNNSLPAWLFWHRKKWSTAGKKAE